MDNKIDLNHTFCLDIYLSIYFHVRICYFNISSIYRFSILNNHLSILDISLLNLEIFLGKFLDIDFNVERNHFYIDNILLQYIFHSFLYILCKFAFHYLVHQLRDRNYLGIHQHISYCVIIKFFNILSTQNQCILSNFLNKDDIFYLFDNEIKGNFSSIYFYSSSMDLCMINNLFHCKFHNLLDIFSTYWSSHLKSM